MSLRKLLAAVPVALIALAAVSQPAFAQTGTLASVKAAGKLRVAMDLGIPPWSYKDDQMKDTGSEVETAKLFAKDLGVELEIVPTTGANRIPFLLSNKADMVISTLGITPAREKIILYSIPYSGANNVVAAPPEVKLKSIEDLAGKSVAVTRGTMLDTAITSNAPKTTNVVRFEDESTTATSIVTNQLDIIAQTEALVAVINQRNPNKHMETKFVLETVRYGMAFRLGNDDFKQWADSWTRTNIANGKLPSIYKQFQKNEMPAAIVQAAKAQQ